MNHLGDTNKMVDTPRMNAARNTAMEHMTGDVWSVGCQLERELNSANQIIRQQQLLEEENQRLKDKIKQLYEGAEEQKRTIKELEEVNEYLREKCLTLEYGRTNK